MTPPINSDNYKQGLPTSQQLYKYTLYNKNVCKIKFAEQKRLQPLLEYAGVIDGTHRQYKTGVKLKIIKFFKSTQNY